MDKIINGKRYNTKTAKFIGKREYGDYGDYEHVREELYQKKTGELFLYCEGGPETGYGKRIGPNTWTGGKCIIPEDDFAYQYIDIREWVSENCDVVTYIALFGPVTE